MSMDIEQFIDAASDPANPDVMDFTINRDADAPGGPLLSMQALETMRQQMFAFVGARIMAHNKRTAEPTRKVVARVTVSVNDTTAIPMVGEFLWWEATDGEGARPDGSMRKGGSR